MISALAGKENQSAKLNSKAKSKDITPTPHFIKAETPHDPKTTNQGALKIQKTAGCSDRKKSATNHLVSTRSNQKITSPNIK